MPRRRSGNDELRAIEAIARIHDKTRRRSIPEAVSPGPPEPPRARGMAGRKDMGWQPGPAASSPAAPSPRSLLESLPRSFRPLPNLERPRSGRRVLGAAVVVTLVGLVAAVVTAGGGSRPSATGTAGGTGSSTVASTPTTLRSAADATRSGHPSARSSRTRSRTKSPSPAGPLQPSSTGSGTASYVISGASGVSVVLAATGGPCWAEASPQAGGAISWEGTIAAGQSHRLPSGASWWIRLGAPAEVTVTANGRPLALPGIGDQPVDVTITAS